MVGYRVFLVVVLLFLHIKSSNLDESKAENYGLLTLSSHISRLFEMCILETYRDYFTTSDLQMGFKKTIGCSHALHNYSNVSC